MKKLTLTLAVILGMTIGASAQQHSMFQRERMDYEGINREATSTVPMLPNHHGLTDDYDAEGPVGSGIAVLIGLGAAYALGKKRKE